MSMHAATIRWTRSTPDFTYDTYDRSHDWTLGTGTTIRASAAHEFRGDPSLPNPEEALVAALSSCHMLTFLAIAARKRLVVESYEDEAVGWLEKNEEGRLAVTRVLLRPRVRFAEDVAPDVLAAMHHQSHELCFIANSVRTRVDVEAR
jgi:organic hydroperoxide reductase OsmC/OhrA